MPKLKKSGKRQKRKKKEKSTLGASNIKGKVYMPQKKSSKRNYSKKKGIFKKLPKKKFKRKNKALRRKKVNISSLFFYIILPLIFIGLLYISVRSVLSMRGDGKAEDKEVEYVIGIEGIPAFPDSQFIFQNNINEISVANFVGSGNSAYRLPLNKNVSQAYAYYEEELPDLGWEHVLSVSVGSEEMKHGEYWVKDNTGLRIYSKFSDVWYELVSVEDAESGLRARVEKEIERDLLLATDDYQELLPDFPWKVKIPKTHIISYGASDYNDLRFVQFRKIGGGEKVTVTPVGRIGEVLDNYLNKYIQIINRSNASEEIVEEGIDMQVQAGGWTIANTVISYTSYARALQGTITNGGEINDVAVVQNLYDNVVYVIHSDGIGLPLFEYVFNNMQPQGME